MSVKIITSVHVSNDCDVDVRVDELDEKKYTVLSIESATIFINSRAKVLEIARLLEQAAQDLDDE